ncbi:MAG: SPOR domain-containing protein [Pseudomonadota bacterium]
MEQNLKQRLVGALVLISLAVIFLPLVFDGQQQRIDTTQYAIPEQPALTLKAVDIEPLEQQAAEELAVVNTITQQKQEQEEQAATQMPADATTNIPAAQPQSPVAPAPAPATPTTQPVSPVATYIEQEKKIDQALQNAPPGQTVDLAEAWIIQVGAFSSQPNADGLRDKLKANGYPAFVKPVKVASGSLFKVYVGPEIRRHRVDQQKLELEQKYQLKALILKYIP